jgi:hypothetical protein
MLASRAVTQRFRSVAVDASGRPSGLDRSPQRSVAFSGCRKFRGSDLPCSCGADARPRDVTAAPALRTVAVVLNTDARKVESRARRFLYRSDFADGSGSEISVPDPRRRLTFQVRKFHSTQSAPPVPARSNPCSKSDRESEMLIRRRETLLLLSIGGLLALRVRADEPAPNPPLWLIERNGRNEGKVFMFPIGDVKTARGSRQRSKGLSPKAARFGLSHRTPIRRQRQPLRRCSHHERTLMTLSTAYLRFWDRAALLDSRAPLKSTGCGARTWMASVHGRIFCAEQGLLVAAT